MSEELKTSEELAAEAETSAAETPETTETAAPEEPAETMADYAEELEASFKQIHEGDILTGTVIGVSESEITLDLKYYTEGIIRRFFRNYPLLLLYPMYLNFASSNCLPHLPYIVRFIIFNLLLVPSTNPLL